MGDLDLGWVGDLDRERLAVDRALVEPAPAPASCSIVSVWGGCIRVS